MADITSLMGGFNAAEYEEKPEFDNSPLPDGEYYLEIENAIVKQTANGKGTGCNVTFSVLGDVHDKAHKGRKLFAWFTLQHENEIAQSIGQREFHGLRLAIGKENAADTDEFIGANLVAAVGIDKKDAERNQIKRYKALEGYTAPAAKPTPAAPPAAAAPAKKKNPWD
jgi:hypothetical protein